MGFVLSAAASRTTPADEVSFVASWFGANDKAEQRSSATSPKSSIPGVSCAGAVPEGSSLRAGSGTQAAPFGNRTCAGHPRDRGLGTRRAAPLLGFVVCAE